MRNNTADVVVIGGGVTGTSTAMHLAKRGAGKVVLVEKNHLASGATGRSGAMVRQHYLHPVLVGMAKEASHIFYHFSDAVGGDARFRQTSRMLLFGEVDRAAAEANVAMNRELGVNISTVSPEEIRDLVPQLVTDGVDIGVWEPEGGYADPMATTYAFAEQARQNGAEILTRTAVKGLRVRSERLTGVVTSEGVIETDTALNATGPWGNLIAGDVADLLPIRPIRVQMIHLWRPPVLHSLETTVVDFTTGSYCRIDNGDCSLVGSEALEDMQETVNPDGFGLNADHDTIVRFWDRIRRRIPGFEGATCRGGYGSLYDLTPDGNPILDRSALLDGLYWAVGFSGHGFKLSPVVGRMMAEFIMEGHTDHDIGRFRLSRFAEGDMLLAEHPYTGRVHQ